MRNEIQVAGQQTGIKLRPYEHHAKYYETDQMGIIHHSNYVKWMEEARMDLMDQMGLSYKQMEEMEIISPVLSIAVEYHSMVHFDDTVVIPSELLPCFPQRGSSGSSSEFHPVSLRINHGLQCT